MKAAINRPNFYFTINRPNFYFKETTYPSSRQQGLTVYIHIYHRHPRQIVFCNIHKIYG